MAAPLPTRVEEQVDVESPVLDVAVIIPCYNDGATVIDTVRSAQMNSPAEIVVVDDGSTDPATLAVMERLRAEGVTVVRRTNGGLAAARMTGVEATTASCVIPLDADDELTPGAAKALLAALDANPGAAVAYGDFELFGAMRGRRTSGPWDPWLICHVNRIAGGGAAIRRSALLAAGGWVLESGWEDWDLWMSLLEQGQPAVRVPRVVFRYRQGSGRMLSGTRSRHDELYARLQSRHPNLFAARRRNWWRSSSPLHARVSIPLLMRLPFIDPATRHRLALFSYNPIYGIHAQWQRRRSVSRRSP